MSNRNKGAGKSVSSAKQDAKSSKSTVSSAKQEADEKPVQGNTNGTQGESTASRMKQAMSLTGVVFLLALYLLTFVLAITDNSASLQLFYASVVATIVIPVLIWGYLVIYRLMNKEDGKEGNREDNNENNK